MLVLFLFCLQIGIFLEKVQTCPYAENECFRHESNKISFKVEKIVKILSFEKVRGREINILHIDRELFSKQQKS